MDILRSLMLSVVFVAVSLSSGAKTFLVSAGVSDYSGYPYKAQSLRLPTSDAKTIAEIYSVNKRMKNSRGSIDYVLLLDSVATKEKIIMAMNKVYSKANEDDIVIFFFSGHGFNGGFCAYDGDIYYNDIRKAMANSKSKNKMIFADACRSGGLRGDRAQSSDTAEADAKKANVMLLLSSRTNENSIERSDMKNGFFTEYLKKGLRGNADVNKDRTITAMELFNFVHNGVKEISSDKQHPVMWGNFDDNMPVMKW
ncbi:MAG: caspase family protein [Bacteroides sp.]|nr:caspase family protein [Bacteroides sp.]